MRALAKNRIFHVASIIDFCDKIDDFGVSAVLPDYPISVRVLWIFVNSIILVLILSPRVAVRESKRLLVVR